MKKIFWALTISISTYLVYFYYLLPEKVLIGGGDAENYFYPIRFYLYEALRNFKFPFWTESMYAGYPIYAAAETMYLNPINLVFTFLMGPFVSYKILHFTTYLVGSISLWILLKERKINFFGYFAANLTYYFSFFFLYHQQHFGIILTLYLLPCFVLLLHKYIYTSRLRWLNLLLVFIVYIFTIGAYQSILLMFFSGLFYLISEKENLSRSKIKYLLLTGLWSILVSAFQLLPTLELYLNSVRSNAGVSFTEGSFFPLMLVNIGYPFLFKTGDLYKWNIISGEYLIHETYIYLGVSTLIIVLVGLLNTKNKKIGTYFYASLFAFLFLGLIRTITGISNIEIPVINLFRYWGRSVVLLLLPIALIVGDIVSNNQDIKFKVPNMFKTGKAIIPTIFILAVLQFHFFQSSDFTSTFIEQIKKKAFTMDDYFYHWIIIIIGTALSFFLVKTQKFRAFLLCLAIFVDLYGFGMPVLQDYITVKPYILNTEFKSADRKIIQHPDNYYNKGLYQQDFNIFGYSQFEISKFDQLLKKHDIQSYKTFSGNMDEELAKELNIDEIILRNNTKINVKNTEDDVVAYYTGVNSKKWIIDSKEPTSFNTKVINYPGWDTTSPNIISKDNDLFVHTKLNTGLNIIELNFKPDIFYFGMVVSGISLIGYITVLNILKTRKDV